MAVQFEKGRALGALSLTPLIDVVFLLLIFFILVARFETEEKEIQLQLASASEALPVTHKPNVITINIDQNGVYFVKHKIYDEDTLEDYLIQASADNPQRQRVSIRADNRVRHQYVLAAINLCKKAKIEDVDFPTE